MGGSASRQRFGPNSVLTYAQVVGSVVRAAREEKGLDQATCGSAIGLKQASYSRLERGAVVLSVAQLRQLSLLVGVTPVVMLERAETVIRFARVAGWHVEDGGATPEGAASIVALVIRALSEAT